MLVVANSTPLIALSKIGSFGLLKEYFGKVIITGEVYAEVVKRGGDLFGAKEVSTSEWIKIIKIDDKDGRTMAANLGILITGTAGLLKLAAEDGKVDLKNSLDELMASGFRLSKSEYKKIVDGI